MMPESDYQRVEAVGLILELTDAAIIELTRTPEGGYQATFIDSAKNEHAFFGATLREALDQLVEAYPIKK